MSVIYDPPRGIPSFVSTGLAKPINTPTEFFSLRRANGWEIEHQAVGGVLNLTGPADLYIFETELKKWVLLQKGIAAQTVSLLDGEVTRVNISTGSHNAGAVHLAYTTIVDGGAAIHLARTKDDESG